MKSEIIKVCAIYEQFLIHRNLFKFFRPVACWFDFNSSFLNYERLSKPLTMQKKNYDGIVLNLEISTNPFWKYYHVPTFIHAHISLSLTKPWEYFKWDFRSFSNGCKIYIYSVKLIAGKFSQQPKSNSEEAFILVYVIKLTLHAIMPAQRNVLKMSK